MQTGRSHAERMIDGSCWVCPAFRAGCPLCRRITFRWCCLTEDGRRSASSPSKHHQGRCGQGSEAKHLDVLHCFSPCPTPWESSHGLKCPTPFEPDTQVRY